MKLRTAAYTLKNMLDRADVSHSHPEVMKGWTSCTYSNPDFGKAWKVLKEYAKQQTSSDIDLLEFRCGIAEACGPNVFHAHFNRRFRIGSQGSDPHVAAVQCQFDYGWRPELKTVTTSISENACASENFFCYVESLKEFQLLVREYSPKSLTIFRWSVALSV